MMILQRPVLGIDIGGTNMRFALVDGSLCLKAYEQFSTQAVFCGGAPPTEKLAEHIRAYCARHLAGAMPAAVSIGFPSTINRARTVVVQTPNIAGIPDDYAVVQELGGALALPVYINRDVNNLFLFDIEDLGLTGCSCVTGIYFGTGIGNAVMVDGKLLLGHNGAAAELGHLPVYGNRRICKCGNPSMVLGGGFLQMEGFPRAQLEALVHRYARKPYPERNLRLCYSRPNQQNGPVGAAIYARKRMADAQYL